MADHQQQPAAPAAYSTKQIAESKAIVNEILAELKASPDVQVQFVKLLSGLATHGGGDKHAVGSRAADLLRGHPGVLRRFTAVVHTPFTADVHVDDALALTTPRRSRSRRGSERRSTPTQQTPAAAAPEEAPPNVAAAARNHRHRVVDDGRRLRLADDDGARALTFVKRVHDTAGPVIHDRFLAVLSEAEGSEDMFADEIYGRAKRAFGPAHVGLLHAFATAWLPGEEEWKLQQQQARGGPPPRQRSRAAAAASVLHAGLPGAKTKKPRAADDDDGSARRHDDSAVARRRRSRSVAASSHAAADMTDGKKPKSKPRADGGSNGREHDHVIAVVEVRNVKRRRGDGPNGRGVHDALRIGESSGGGAAAAPQGRDYEYATRSRAKKPRSGNSEFSGSAAAAQVLGIGAGVHHAYSGDNKKPLRRRAANGGKGSSAGAEQQQPERDEEVRRFRQEWEFQTGYSKLVATSDRITELLPHRCRIPHGDGDGAGDRSLQELFPLPECREFLRYCYGDRWGEMRVALESGDSRVPALEAIAHRLTTKEEEAVVEESRKRCRHDPGRVAQRLHGLAMDTQLDEERRRHYHGGGA